MMFYGLYTLEVIMVRYAMGYKVERLYYLEVIRVRYDMGYKV